MEEAIELFATTHVVKVDGQNYRVPQVITLSQLELFIEDFILTFNDVAFMPAREFVDSLANANPRKISLALTREYLSKVPHVHREPAAKAGVEYLRLLLIAMSKRGIKSTELVTEP